MCKCVCVYVHVCEYLMLVIMHSACAQGTHIWALQSQQGASCARRQHCWQQLRGVCNAEGDRP
jgi:hypothetical protein